MRLPENDNACFPHPPDLTMRYALRPIAVGYAGTQCPKGEQTAARILTMPCPEKIRLIEEYTAATSELYIAVTVVRSSSGVELMRLSMFHKPRAPNASRCAMPYRATSLSMAADR